LYKRDYGVFKNHKTALFKRDLDVNFGAAFQRSGIYNKTAPEAKGSFKTKREHTLLMLF
jgi:hypothetical protein